jgi:hypothetical protein
VRIRAGAPLTFPKVESPSPALAGAVTDRIWPCIELQWEWLGGTPSIRRAAIVGDGPPASGIATALAGAGFEIERLGARPAPNGRRASAPRNHLAHSDLVCFACSADELPAALGAYTVPDRAGVLVLDDAHELVVASSDRSFLTQVSAVLESAGFDVEHEPTSTRRSRAA